MLPSETYTEPLRRPSFDRLDIKALVGYSELYKTLTSIPSGGGDALGKSV